MLFPEPDQLLGRLKAMVGFAGCKQPLDQLSVQAITLRLEIRAVVAANLGALIPIEAQEAHPVKNRLGRLRSGSLTIGVLYAKHQGSPALAGEEIVEKRRPGAANMKISRRRRSETNSDRFADSLRVGAFLSHAAKTILPQRFTQG